MYTLSIVQCVAICIYLSLLYMRTNAHTTTSQRKAVYMPSNGQFHVVMSKIEKSCKGQHKNITELHKCKNCMQLEQMIDEELHALPF